MSKNLVLKLAIVLFLTDIMYTTALQPCNSTTDCDNGHICCKNTKMCVSKCKRKFCREDSDCNSGECCNSIKTCTETNCSKDDLPVWKTTLIVIGCALGPFGCVMSLIFCFAGLLDGSSNSRSGSAVEGVSSEGGYGGGYDGRCGDGGGDGEGCGGDGGGDC